MPLLFNEEDVPRQIIREGVTSQTLLDHARIGNDRLVLDRNTLEPGAALPFEIKTGGFAWVLLLAGDGSLDGHGEGDRITPDHLALLPPGFKGHFTADKPTILLCATVPGAVRFDERFTASPPPYRVVDWTREPVLDAEHDARKRIYMVTPKMFATKAFKGEMIIYPPNTEAPNHHHEGAEHFQYVTSGAGTVYLSEQPHPMRAGDVLYNYEHERHYFENTGDENFVFVEFFIPGDCKTVWVPGADVCAWVPTGKDIEGRAPVRDIKAHSSELTVTPEDV